MRCSRSVRVVGTTTIEIYWGKYVKIDYTNLGSTTGSFVGSGFFDISSLSGIYDTGSRYTYPQINLDTRKIIGLPRRYINGDVNGQKLVDHFWSVETDDFATTVTAPTPQETTEEVSGTKISELPSATTLQDDDLLVISRDEESDGSFDASYNISLSDLAAKMTGGGSGGNFAESPESEFTATTEYNASSNPYSVRNGPYPRWEHNLGQVPRFYSMSLRCKVAEEGWGVGDEFLVGYNGTYNRGEYAVYADSTYVGFIFKSTTTNNPFTVGKKEQSGNNPANITANTFRPDPSKCQIVFRANT